MHMKQTHPVFFMQAETGAYALLVDVWLRIRSQVYPGMSARSILDCITNSHTSNNAYHHRNKRRKQFSKPICLKILSPCRPAPLHSTPPCVCFELCRLSVLSEICRKTLFTLNCCWALHASLLTEHTSTYCLRLAWFMQNLGVENMLLSGKFSNQTGLCGVWTKSAFAID